jgi:hypothetical protein
MHASFVSFMEEVVLPARTASPTDVRLDGWRTGGNFAVFGEFEHGTGQWKVHADTHYEPLMLAYEAAKSGIDPFVEVPTKRGSSLDLTDVLRPKLSEPRFKYIYIYERGNRNDYKPKPSEVHWRWIEEPVDQTRDHLRLVHDDCDSVVAIVGEPNGDAFPVQFLLEDDPADSTRHSALQDVRDQLNFYLLDVGRPDPWGYAHYHCGTASNVYSRTHWGFGEGWTGIPWVKLVDEPFADRKLGAPTGAALHVEGDVRFVQFPHPGPEHEPGPSGIRPWPRGNEAHKRTFMQSPAAYRYSIDGDDRHGDVAFWGEWEGETRLVTALEPTSRGPQWLCVPNPQGASPPRNEEGIPPQNTDPFVWGDAIRYGACRQPTNQKLRNLGRGSLILFGSSVGGGFVLDTVLVVAGWVEHHRDTFRQDLAGVTSDDHMRATLEPWHGWKTDQIFRLYVGATPANPVDDMYSFVPCQPAAGAGSGFPRPSIELEGLIKPDLRMQARSSEPLEPSVVRTLWRRVVEQTLSDGLALATRLDLPVEGH